MVLLVATLAAAGCSSGLDGNEGVVFTVATGFSQGAPYCRQRDKPYPVTDAVTSPHSDSNWYVVIAIIFATPGRYQLGRAKILYTSDGQRGWQYQNLDTTVVITAARKGAKPAFSGCP